jgi:hypothetical protein
VKDRQCRIPHVLHSPQCIVPIMPWLVRSGATDVRAEWQLCWCSGFGGVQLPYAAYGQVHRVAECTAVQLQ